MTGATQVVLKLNGPEGRSDPAMPVEISYYCGVVTITFVRKDGRKRELSLNLPDDDGGGAELSYVDADRREEIKVQGLDDWEIPD